MYVNNRGDKPVREFLDSLETNVGAKVAGLIVMLQNNGFNLPPPYSKKISAYLFELRTSGKIAVRIFYTELNGCFYLLHGFKKKSQKTPTKEIKTALDRMKRLI